MVEWLVAKQYSNTLFFPSITDAPFDQIISRLSKFGEKCQILSKCFTGQEWPVNKEITGLRQYLLATGQWASAKLYTVFINPLFFPLTSE